MGLFVILVFDGRATDLQPIRVLVLEAAAVSLALAASLRASVEFLPFGVSHLLPVPEYNFFLNPRVLVVFGAPSV